MSTPLPISKSFDPVMALATAGGVGYTSFAPGTMGALLGVALTYGVYHIPSWVGQIAVMVLLCAVGVPICGYASRKLQNTDPKEVIWDEVTTVPWVFFWIPPELVLQPRMLLLGFLLHRAFDITKPPPLKQFERLPGGWGIMADDIGAAVYACAVLHLLRFLFGW